MSEKGLLAGIFSGAALWAAMQLAKRSGNEGKPTVDGHRRPLPVDGFV